jgi:hypothetical protein
MPIKYPALRQRGKILRNSGEYCRVSQNIFSVASKLLRLYGQKLSCVLLMMCVGVGGAYGSDEADLPLVKLTPQMRVDSQERSLSELSCEGLSKYEAESADQQRALAQRKQECLAQYRQFLPTKALR